MQTKPFVAEVFFPTTTGPAMALQLLDLAHSPHFKQMELTYGSDALTPTVSMVGTAREIIEPDRFLNVMVNPTGQFVYNKREVAVMARQIESFTKAGADGIVVGALTSEGLLDTSAMRTFAKAAGGKPITLHSAVDLISPQNWPRTVEDLKEASSESGSPLTIMTAGGHNGRFPTHSHRILEFQRLAKPLGVAIMARGGITKEMFFKSGTREALRELAQNGGGVHARFDMPADPAKRPSADALPFVAEAVTQFGYHLAHAKKAGSAPRMRRGPAPTPTRG